MKLSGLFARIELSGVNFTCLSLRGLIRQYLRFWWGPREVLGTPAMHGLHCTVPGVLIILLVKTEGVTVSGHLLGQQIEL